MLRKKVMVLILSTAIIATSNIFITSNFVQAVTIKKEYINSNRPGTTLKPEGIVIHATDSKGGTAQNNRDYFNNNPNAQASAHYLVDWNGSVQAIPENETAWHAGYTANHKYLSVEMCEPYSGNQAQFNQVYENTVELVASICKKYGWNSSNIYSHKWVSDTYGETDHTDPIEYLGEYGKTWGGLVSDIEKAINGTNSGGNQTNPNQNASGIIADLQKVLNDNGYGKLSIDNQVSPAMIVACPLLRNGSSGDVVKWLQKRLNIKADGIFGSDTKNAISSFQGANGLDSDGIVGKMTWTKLLNSASQGGTNSGNNSNGNSTTPAVSGSIAELQTALNKIGKNLTVNNNADSTTIAACPLLEENGISGDIVKWVQKRLGVNADGIFGGATKQAVINFQKSNGLYADGEIGKMTWTKLLNSASQSGTNTNSDSQTNPTTVTSGSISELQTILNKNGSNLTVNNKADSATINACPLLRNGSSGDVVKWVQKRLGVNADGIFGDATKQAASNFQKANGLNADGEIGKMTWTKLLNSLVQSGSSTSNGSATGNETTSAQVSSGSISELQTILNKSGNHLVVDNQAGSATVAACPLLRSGSSGEVVKWVQKRLGVNADGIFGDATKQAVSSFQKTNKLYGDGEIGKATWSKLLGI